MFGKPQIHLSFEKLQIFATFFKWIFSKWCFVRFSRLNVRVGLCILRTPLFYEKSYDS